MKIDGFSPISPYLIVYDNKKRIEHCFWFNLDTGEYESALLDENQNMIPAPHFDVMRKIHKGNLTIAFAPKDKDAIQYGESFCFEMIKNSDQEWKPLYPLRNGEMVNTEIPFIQVSPNHRIYCLVPKFSGDWAINYLSNFPWKDIKIRILDPLRSKIACINLNLLGDKHD